MKKFRLLFILAVIAAFIGFVPSSKAHAEVGDVVTTNDMTLKCISKNWIGIEGWDVISYSGKASELVIPEYYKELPILSIEKEAFKGNEYIKSVTIPQTVCKLWPGAFKDCKSLESVTIAGDCCEWLTKNGPDSYASDRGPIILSQDVFENCTSLASLEIPYGWAVNGNASSIRFMKNSGVKYLKLVITEKSFAAPSAFFNECPELEKIDIVLKKHILLNLTDIGQMPKLKEINVYEDYDIGSGGSSTQITDGNFSAYQFDRTKLSQCPKLESINFYVGTETIERKTSFAAFSNKDSAVKASDLSCVEVSNSNDYTFVIKSEGRCEFTVDGIPFKMTLIIGEGKSDKKNLSDAEIYLPADTFVYTGEEIEPYAVLVYGKTVLTEGTDYTVKCTDNKKVGTAKITFTGKGDYTGEVSAEYYIGPDLVPVYLKKAVISGKTAKLEWNTFKGADGYQVYYSSKESKGYKKLYSGKDTSFDSKKVKSGMYIRIRTYKKVGKKTYYSEWSAPVQMK